MALVAPVASPGPGERTSHPVRARTSHPATEQDCLSEGTLPALVHEQDFSLGGAMTVHLEHDPELTVSEREGGPMLAHVPSQSDLHRAVAAALTAPSIYNSQPWAFRVSTNDDFGTVDLFADRSRAVPVVDPTGRQLEVGCGVALLFLRVALRAAGWDAEVTLLPDDDPDHLAAVTVRRGPASTPEELAMAGAIAVRHTQPSAFEARAVAPELLERLRRAAEAEGAWLAVLHRQEDRLALVALLAHAERVESRDPAFRAEMQSWLRTEPSPDGIPRDGLPASTGRHSDLTFRDFNPERAGQPSPTEPIDEHPALVVLGTDGDSRYEHLIAGVAVGRLLLRAAEGGVNASPLGQLIDLPGPREALRRELDLVGEPQIVLRLGYGDASTALRAGRRSLEDVLLT